MGCFMLPEHYEEMTSNIIGLNFMSVHMMGFFIAFVV